MGKTRWRKSTAISKQTEKQQQQKEFQKEPGWKNESFMNIPRGCCYARELVPLVSQVVIRLKREARPTYLLPSSRPDLLRGSHSLVLPFPLAPAQISLGKADKEQQKELLRVE
ncbi:uncharacterized protein RBU33_022616 isoform 1-T1 [Hipposideros larvatus]